MDGTKQNPPPGYYQVPTEPPAHCPYPVQAGYNPQPYNPSFQQQPMYAPPPQQQQLPGGAYYATAPPGQPVIVGQPQYMVAQPGTAGVAVYQQAPPQQFIGAIVLAAFTFLCCGGLCGFIALILAVFAHIKASSSPASARYLGRSSIIVSVIGIVFTVVILVIYIGLMASHTAELVDALGKLHNNGTFSDDYEDMSKMELDMKCREIARMSIRQRNRETDPTILQWIEICEAARTSTSYPRRSTIRY